MDDEIKNTSKQQSRAEKKKRREERRAQRKKDYDEYLKSVVWQNHRSEILARDNFKCRGCSEKAVAVHHRCYPRTLGKENYDWLFSVCEACHYQIHELQRRTGTSLRNATDAILFNVPVQKKQGKKRITKRKINVTSVKTETVGANVFTVLVIEDDWRLKKSAAKWRSLKNSRRAYKPKQHKRRDD